MAAVIRSMNAQEQFDFLQRALLDIDANAKMGKICKQLTLIMKIRGMNISMSAKEGDISLAGVLDIFNHVLPHMGLPDVFLRQSGADLEVVRRG